MVIQTKYASIHPTEQHTIYAVVEKEGINYLFHRAIENDNRIMVSIVKTHPDGKLILNPNGSFEIKATANGFYNETLDKIIEKKDGFQMTIGKFFDEYSWSAGEIPEKTGLEKFIENLRFNGVKYENK